MVDIYQFKQAKFLVPSKAFYFIMLDVLNKFFKRNYKLCNFIFKPPPSNSWSVSVSPFRFTARITELISVLDDLNKGRYERTMVNERKQEGKSLYPVTCYDK